MGGTGIRSLTENLTTHHRRWVFIELEVEKIGKS